MDTRCKVDFIAKEIKVTRNFYRESQSYGTEAFEMMLSLSAKLPNFRIMICETARRGCSNFMPSYSFMEDIIVMSTKEYVVMETRLKEFAEIRDMARLTGKGYHMVRKWFMENYPPMNSTKEYRVA